MAYCLICDIMVCQVCLIESHAVHTFRSLETMCTTIQHVMRLLNEDADFQINAMKDARKVIASVAADHLKMTNASTRELEVFFTELKSLIVTRHQELLKEVHTKSKEKSNILLKQDDLYHLLIINFEENISSIKAVIQSSSSTPVDVLYHYSRFKSLVASLRANTPQLAPKANACMLASLPDFLIETVQSLAKTNLASQLGVTSGTDMENKTAGNSYTEKKTVTIKDVLCLYTAPFDANGVLYYLGTRGGTQPYTNPHAANIVMVTFISCANGERANFVDHKQNVPIKCFTNNTPGSWMCLDLGVGKSLIVNYYCLR